MKLQGLFIIGFACVSLLTAVLAPVGPYEPRPLPEHVVTIEQTTQENCVTFGFEIDGQSLGCVQPVLAVMGRGFFKKHIAK